MTAATVRRAVVVADGDAPTRAELDAAWPGWDAGIDVVIGADGGARRATPLGLRLDAWVGDGDSLDDDAIRALEVEGVSVHRVAAAKDETDTELAVLAALEAGAGDVTILGALGGPRIDHGLANLALLAHPALAGRPARILGAGGVRISLVAAPGPDGGPTEARFDGRPGDLVSLLPVFGRVEGVTTEGLAYPLRDEPLEVGPARGVSNVRLGPTAIVRLRAGRLLVIETPASLDR